MRLISEEKKFCFFLIIIDFIKIDMMKKYIIYCIIVVVSVFASFLFFDKYYKKSTLLGEIGNTYVFSYDHPLIIGNVEIEELSKFNQTLAD